LPLIVSIGKLRGRTVSLVADAGVKIGLAML
jgi:hypothetical protein